MEEERALGSFMRPVNKNLPSTFFQSASHPIQEASQDSVETEDKITPVSLTL